MDGKVQGTTTLSEERANTENEAFVKIGAKLRWALANPTPLEHGREIEKYLFNPTLLKKRMEEIDKTIKPEAESINNLLKAENPSLIELAQAHLYALGMILDDLKKNLHGNDPH